MTPSDTCSSALIFFNFAKFSRRERRKLFPRLRTFSLKKRCSVSSLSSLSPLLPASLLSPLLCSSPSPFSLSYLTNNSSPSIVLRLLPLKSNTSSDKKEATLTAFSLLRGSLRGRGRKGERERGINAERGGDMS